MASHWMIYGANGYTGRLVAEQAQREGLTPLLGGRNPAALHALGSQLGLECRVFDLGDPQACREALDQVKVVAHCAGPFSATSTPMIAACRAAGTTTWISLERSRCSSRPTPATPRPARPASWSARAWASM